MISKRFTVRSRIGRRLRGYAATSAVAASLCLAAGHASAQDLAAAANAFSQAQKAELGGDFDAAAELYELADSAAPSPEALRSAMRTRKAAGQLGMAAAHAEAILQLYKEDKRSRDVAEATLSEAKKKLVRYAIHCQPKPCSVAVDGTIVAAGTKEDHVIFLDPASHEISASFGSLRSEPQTAIGEAGEEKSLTFDAPPEPPPQPLAEQATTGGADGGVQVDEGGLPPWIFIASSVVTVGLGAVAVWSGMDVKKKHDDYQSLKDGSDQKAAEDAYADGNRRETRTNVLFAATAVAAVGTGVLAIITDWDGKPQATAQARGFRSVRVGGHVAHNGGIMAIQGRF